MNFVFDELGATEMKNIMFNAWASSSEPVTHKKGSGAIRAFCYL